MARDEVVAKAVQPTASSACAACKSADDNLHRRIDMAARYEGLCRVDRRVLRSYGEVPCLAVEFMMVAIVLDYLPLNGATWFCRLKSLI